MIRLVAVGDVGDPTPLQGQIAQRILEEHKHQRIDALLILGDIVYPRGDPRQFDEKFWANFGPIADAGVRFLPVLGNHDIQTDRAGMMSRLGMQNRYYESIIGDVQLLGLDTSVAQVEDEQAIWLEERLSDGGPRWRIPFMHVSPYSSGMHGDHLQLQKVLGPIFERNDVPIVIAAHDHNYERTSPIDGTIYVVTGAGCCPRDVRPGPRTEASSSEGHFVLLELTFESIRLRAVSADGRVFDSLHIPARELAPVVGP